MLVTLSGRYKPALLVALVSVIFFAVLSGLALDMGECFITFVYSLIAYAGLLVMVLSRRPSTPTNADLLVIKWGFTMLFLTGLLIYPRVWYARGLY